MSGSMGPRVFIVDDHGLFRAGVRSVKDEGTEVTLRMPRTTGSQAMSRA